MPEERHAIAIAIRAIAHFVKWMTVAAGTPAFLRQATRIGLVTFALLAALPYAFADIKPSTPELRHTLEELSSHRKTVLYDEIEWVEKSCTGHAIFSAYQDCTCIATRFFDERLSGNDTIAKETLMNSISTTCVNRPGIKTYANERCLRSMRRSYPNAKENNVDDFCACVSDKVVKGYAAKPINSIGYQTNLTVRARTECGHVKFLQEAERQRTERLRNERSQGR